MVGCQWKALDVEVSGSEWKSVEVGGSEWTSLDVEAGGSEWTSLDDRKSEEVSGSHWMWAGSYWK